MKHLKNYLLITFFFNTANCSIGFGTNQAGYNNTVPKEFWTVKQLANGKFIVVGDYGADVNDGAVIARFTEKGALDTTFAAGVGYAPLNIDAGDEKFLDAIELSDGSLLVAGEIATDALLVKYQQNGLIDAAFGTGGMVIFDHLITVDDKFWQIQQLSDGTLIACGSDDEAAGAAILLKFDQDGNLDFTFGTDGIVAFADAATFRGMIILDNGKIVAVGHKRGGGDNALIAQFNADGQVDTDFGTNGIAELSRAGSAEGNAIRKTADGHYIIVGNDGGNTGNGFIARFTSRGVLDTTFGINSGFTLVSESQLFWDCLIDDQERIIAIGRTTSSTDTSVGIVTRFLPNGQLDTTFGINGSVFIPNVVVLRGIAITQNQTIRVCGDGKDNKGHIIGLLSDGSFDALSEWNVKTFQKHNANLNNSLGLLN
jgi:uncharacterized delta-60 repeat protein